jgi:hypothetical protein
MAALIDGEELPAPSPPRRPGIIAMSGRLARVYGYASLAGPALFAGVPDQALAMIDMALAACRLPQPTEGEEADAEREALASIAPALETALELVRGAGEPGAGGKDHGGDDHRDAAAEGQTKDAASETSARMRGAIDLLYRSIVHAATAVTDAQAAEATWVAQTAS